ncbi:MAG: SIMPL domain-containing protein [Gammaproteobacteria bacterium]|nr:SIMPL domain-containing protein [Gammaproteobacteria bacterium]
MNHSSQAPEHTLTSSRPRFAKLTPAALLSASLLCIGLTTPALSVAQTDTSAAPMHSETFNPTQQGNKIHFSVSESENMTNDTISIVFRRTAQGTTAEAVANKINTQMQSAMAIVNKYPDIIPKTSHYRINPVYNKKQVITHWKGSQSLSLIFENKPGMIQMLTLLQPYLSYQSMRFGISDDRKKEMTDHLTLKAIHAFQARAQAIAQAFSASNYRILETRINTPSHNIHQPSYTSNRMMMAESMVAPSVATGESQIKVTVSGIMQLP